MVYSTNPSAGLCRDGNIYVIKGENDQEVVQAEASAYALANEIKLPVPKWKFVNTGRNSHLLFGSAYVVGYRNVEQWIKSKAIVNRDVLAKVVAFDIWICNPDRNLESILGRETSSGQPGEIEIVAIDFEKATTLRGSAPNITTASVNPKDLWPSDRLGQLMKGDQPPAKEWLDSLENIEEETVARLLHGVQTTLSLKQEWVDVTTKLLITRARQIHKLVKEVWQ